MRTFIASLAASLVLAAPSFSQQADPGRAIVVLDASGSMWGQIDGRSKIEIARETLREVLGTLPAERELGLIAYGHRRKGDCSDIELVVPPAAGSGNAISAAADKLSPKGKTPLSDAVRQAAEALRSTEEKATVILVTDGLETCDADPCALADELEASGVDFTAHVVGFGLTAEEGAQVSCLAEKTGGRYLEAGDAGALVEALRETVVAEAPPPAPEPEPEPASLPPADNLIVTMALCESCEDMTDEAKPRWDVFRAAPEAKDGLGENVEGGYASHVEMTLEPGDYLLQSRLNGIERRMPFSITSDAPTELHIDWDAGFVQIRAVSTPDATEPLKNARLDLSQGSWNFGGYTDIEGFAPAGEMALEGRMGKATASDSLTVTAGERLEHELVIGSGWLTPVVVYAENGPAVEDSNMRYDIRPAAGGDFVAGGYGQDTADVPAGDMVVEIRLGQARVQSGPITVKAGETVEAPINLNAGVLAISAPGARRIDILAAKQKINGDRDAFGGSYGDTHQETLHPGDYLVRALYEGSDTPKEATVTVTAGERSELTVE